jgi:hypothetical protein
LNLCAILYLSFRLNVLPSKTISQMNLQTQRLLGQQSLAEFMGLHVYMDKVFVDNSIKSGVQRKNKFIINTGNNLTSEEKDRRIKFNQAKYALTKDEIAALRLPVNKSKHSHNTKQENILTLDQIFHPKSNFSIVEKLHHLHNLRKSAIKKYVRIQHRKAYAARPH